MKFKNEQHEQFYNDMQLKVQSCGGNWDIYTMPLFYVLGLSSDCIRHINDLVSIDKNSVSIKPNTAFECDWQTNGSIRYARLAYNLFNGYQDEQTTPYHLFQNRDDFVYFMQACALSVLSD